MRAQHATRKRILSMGHTKSIENTTVIIYNRSFQTDVAMVACVDMCYVMFLLELKEPLQTNITNFDL